MDLILSSQVNLKESIINKIQVISPFKHNLKGKVVARYRDLTCPVLRKLGVTDSPYKNLCYLLEDYGVDFYSKIALQYKKERNLSSGINVAVVSYSLEGKIIRILSHTEGWKTAGMHSELLAIEKVPKEGQIQWIYTERAPCNTGMGCLNCNGKIKATLKDIPVYYSSDYPKDAEERKKIEAIFRARQEALGVKKSPIKKLKQPQVFNAEDLTIHKAKKHQLSADENTDVQSSAKKSHTIYSYFSAAACQSLDFSGAEDLATHKGKKHQLSIDENIDPQSPTKPSPKKAHTAYSPFKAAASHSLDFGAYVDQTTHEAKKPSAKKALTAYSHSLDFGGGGGL